jgi:Rha family phage regulatory protein
MNELIKVVDDEIFADSRMIAEHFGKQHGHVLRDITDEIEKLGDFTQSIFGLSNYKDSTGRTLPCYTMNEEGLMQIAARYDAVARRKLIVKIKELKQNNKSKLPNSYKEALLKLVEQIEETEKIQLLANHRQEVITALVEPVDLATKRQRLNQIMRFKFTNSTGQTDKWGLLYKEFEAKYHVNLKVKMERDLLAKPKYKNKLDYIDRKMNMITELYELACKIFENDVEKLKAEWFDTVNY